MASRVGLVAMLSVVACLVLSTAAAHPAGGRPTYVVRVDPRLCPSPLCGGYWVARANGARTTCANGLRYPRCYVARAVDTQGRPRDVADGALVYGALGAGHDDLGELVVGTVFAPVGTAPLGGRYYRLIDTGIRCVRAPCFSLRAWLVNRRSSTAVSGLVLDTLGGREPLEKRVLAALATKNGVLARARIVRAGNGGRELHATRFYLESAG